MAKVKQLRLGIPKGSLQKRTLDLFQKAGFSISVNARSYFPQVDDQELKLFLIRAQELSRYVEEGVLDCAITGEDWILENNSKVVRVTQLNYSKATNNPVRWVVAVREDSSINSLKQLEGKRIATELVQYSKRFFKKQGIKVTVEFSWGATEVKVKSGLVDAIVDLTETGESLRANGLKEIATVCYSTTQFIVNKQSFHDAFTQDKIKSLLVLLKGALDAENKVGLKLNVHEKNLNKILSILPALKTPTISLLTLDKWYALEVVVEETSVRELIPRLKAQGAQGMIEYPLNKLVY